MKLGVCYYPEHWPEDRWPEDARLMRAAGLDLVRIAEFAWAKMEPAEGRYDWSWLDRAIDTLAAAGLQVVLGTPTATPPAWLVRAHPEVLPVDSQGRVRQFGSRRHYCANSPVYRDYTTRIVTALAHRYAAHPAVVGWQIDNEFGCHDTARCYCPRCAAAFREWLKARYGSLEALNQAWGTVFWSQTYSGWEQILPPNLTVTEPNASQVLDYYRFSSDSVVAYQQLQLDLLRRLTHGQRITHNLMGNFPDLDYHKLSQPLDFVCWDSYPTGYAEVQAESLYLPDEPRPPVAYDVGDPYVTGFCHDLTRGLKQGPYWVMEQQPGGINWARLNPGVRPGAVRLWTWHALGSGAEAVVYFRWRACRFAQEQYHTGLLKHDASPDTGYEEVLRLLPEREQMARLAAEPVQPQVAMLLDYNDLWALQLQPHHRDFGYLRLLFRYYAALARLGLAVDLVSPQADLGRYKLVLAPSLHLAGEALAVALERYVEAGGALLLGVRSGFKTPTNLVTDQPLPGALHRLAGASVRYWHALPPGVSFPYQSGIPGLGGQAGLWAEALEPDPDTEGAWKRARLLAHYTAGPFAGLGALTQADLGAGRVWYAGWYPAPAQAQALLAYLAAELGLETIPNLPEGMLVCRRGGCQVWLNFTETPQTVPYGETSITIEPRNLRVIA